jgi:hypothetical protein
MSWNVQTVCQIGVVLSMTLTFFVCVKYDFEGRKAKEPAGFRGFIGSIVGTAVMAALYWGAGAFDLLF